MANLLRRRDYPQFSNVFEDPMRMMRDQMRRLESLMRVDPFGATFDVEPLGVGIAAAYTPEFDVRENDDNILISADLPGVNLENVDIQVTGNRLRISGSREAERKEEGYNWYTAERSYGCFTRTFTLPEGANVDNVKADLTNGVLTVTIPKLAGVGAKRIAVTGAAPAIEQKAEVKKEQKVAQKEKVEV